MTKNFERNLFKKFALKSSRSAPVINETNFQSTEKIPTIKSAVVLSHRTAVQESQQHLDVMNKLVDQTDQSLRQAIEHAAIRHEQLEQLRSRSQEMLDKNENLVFGITNYRKTQERDIFWRRFQYTACGTLTIGLIILLVLLSMTSKRSTSSSQTLDIRYSNQDLVNRTRHEKNSNAPLSNSRKRRRRKREILI